MFTINSECGVMRNIDAADVAEAKQIYTRKFHFDFEGAAAGEYPGSWYFIDRDDVRTEDFTAEMPN